MLEELLAPPRPDRGDLLETGGGARLAALRAVPRDREAVRLVSNLLDQVQGRVVRGEPARLGLSRDDHLPQSGPSLLPLRDAHPPPGLEPRVPRHRRRA